MILETQWLTKDQTKRLLDETDTTLKRLRRENEVVSTTLEGKLHYRLDSLLKFLGIGECTTYHAPPVVASPTVLEEEPKKKEEAKHEVAEAESNTLRFISHCSKEWKGIVGSETLPCFLSKDKHGEYKTKKSLHAYLVDINVYETGNTGVTSIKAQLTLRSVKNPNIVFILQLYPLIYYPSKVLQTFLENFEAGENMLFTNSLVEGKQHYSLHRVIDNEKDLINKWEEPSWYEKALNRQQVINLASAVKIELKRHNKLEAIQSPSIDQHFTKLIDLGESTITSLADEQF